MINPAVPNGPIPGENLLSDSRNYPWKRPPETNTPDEAMEKLFTSLRKKRNAQGLLNMLEMGFTVSFITHIILLKGVEQGRWSIDTALLIAGAISHMIVIMAREYKIDYDMGLEGDIMLPDGEFFKRAKKAFSEQKQDKAVDTMEETVSMDSPAGFGDIRPDSTSEGKETPVDPLLEASGAQEEPIAPGGFM